MRKANQLNKYKENFAEFNNNTRFGELVDRKFTLLNNVIILKYLNAGEEFLKYDGKSVLLLVFIFIQQIPDALLNEQICAQLMSLVEVLLGLIANFLKEDKYECYLDGFDVIYCYFAKFLDKVINIYTYIYMLYKYYLLYINYFFNLKSRNSFNFFYLLNRILSI